MKLYLNFPCGQNFSRQFPKVPNSMGRLKHEAVARQVRTKPNQSFLFIKQLLLRALKTKKKKTKKFSLWWCIEAKGRLLTILCAIAFTWEGNEVNWKGVLMIIDFHFWRRLEALSRTTVALIPSCTAYTNIKTFADILSQYFFFSLSLTMP